MPQIQIFGCRVACTSFVPEIVRAGCVHRPNAEKFDNQNRGQLLSFLFAVAANRTMGL
jgi:hypothetical protein